MPTILAAVLSEKGMVRKRRSTHKKGVSSYAAGIIKQSTSNTHRYFAPYGVDGTPNRKHSD